MQRLHVCRIHPNSLEVLIMARKRNYAAEYKRRLARARTEGYGSFWQKRAAASHAADYSHLTTRQKDVWQRAFRAARLMADKQLSLAQAARRQRTTAATVRKYGGDWLERRGSRWVPARSFLENQDLVDRPQSVRVITPEGVTSLMLPDATTRSEYARYLNFVKGSLHGVRGSKEELAKFEGKAFTDAAGKKHPYVTDRRLLIRLYDDGKIPMDQFYGGITR
jgi:hypothetical protein